MRLGIMGGTFDPIHYGHLVAAEEARAAFGLDLVTFVPSRQPPHKKDYRISEAEHRYAMAVTATCTNPCFTASRIELERAGPSYTIDTLSQFHGSRPDAELFFITGADAVRELLTWREPRRLVALCRFVAVTRPGYDLGELERELGDLAGEVGAIEVPGVNVSSTQIRERVAQGRSIKYLTPDAVVIYIAKHGLYRGGDGQPEKKGGD